MFLSRVSWYRTQNRVIDVKNNLEVLKPFIKLNKAFTETVNNRKAKNGGSGTSKEALKNLRDEFFVE